MIVRCLDFETTGLPPKAGVCEVGWTDVTLTADTIEIGDTFAELCNPGIPMDPRAEEVHGISDEMVADARPSTIVMAQLMNGADVLCAHNCEFEQNFFGGGDLPWICTYKVALVAHPNLPNHKNGELPSHLGIELDPDRCAPLHRAGPDTYVTARNLSHMLERHAYASGNMMASAQAFIAITKKPRLIARMPFGKHKGCRLDELPDTYIAWAVANMDAKDVRDALAREQKRRRAAA